MEERIENAAAAAQEAFWASIAAAFPEVRSGDFPPDAHMAFERACIDATTTGVEGNMPQPQVQEND